MMDIETKVDAIRGGHLHVIASLTIGENMEICKRLRNAEAENEQLRQRVADAEQALEVSKQHLDAYRKIYSGPIPQVTDHVEHNLNMVQRITEQDAREICNHFIQWLNDFEDQRKATIAKWLDDEGRDLLNKLNADREQVLDDAPTQEQWDYYQTLLKQNGFDGITDLLAKYHKLVEQVPAVAVLEKKPLPDLMMASYHEAKGWNDCIDAMLSASPAPSHSQQSDGEMA